MKPQTTAILYKVQDKLGYCRSILDDYMYRSGGIPDEDLAYCRKVYDKICKALDLL